jgi:hypothetical protein
LLSAAAGVIASNSSPLSWYDLDEDRLQEPKAAKKFDSPTFSFVCAVKHVYCCSTLSSKRVALVLCLSTSFPSRLGAGCEASDLGTAVESLLIPLFPTR